MRNEPQRTQSTQRKKEGRKEGKGMRSYVEEVALLLGLQLGDEYVDGVVQNFEIIKAIAQIVNEFPLPEEIEPASVFEP
jgi:hypothetical protein